MIRILYVTREDFPTFRVDIADLFGKKLPKLGVHSSIVAKCQPQADRSYSQWGGGEVHLYRSGRFGNILSPLKEAALIAKYLNKYDVLQIRDKAFMGLLGLALSRIFGKKSFFWISWPFPETEIERGSLLISNTNILQPLYTLARGYITRMLQYDVVFRFADHIFVQSDYMKEWLTQKGIDPEKMTPVPMAVDFERLDKFISENPREHRTKRSSKKIIAYLGAISRVRRSDLMLDVFRKVKKVFEQAHLLLIGDAPEGQDLDWFVKLIKECGLEDDVTLTGWIPQEEAWLHLLEATVGINFIPRTIIFDVSSPTKILEYSAFGLPSVVTDNPDQKDLIEKLNCGVSAQYDVNALADALVKVLGNDQMREEFSRQGYENVRKHRNYDTIAERLSEKYMEMLED